MKNIIIIYSKNRCTEIHDRNDISSTAKQILFYMLNLNKTPGTFYKSEIYKHFKEGKTAINTALKELKKFGYLIIEKERGRGKFIGAKYRVYEKASFNPCFGGNLQKNLPDNIFQGL